MSYAADGKVSGFTYGNGIVHSMAENVRGLIASLTDKLERGSVRMRTAGRSLAAVRLPRVVV